MKQKDVLNLSSLLFQFLTRLANSHNIAAIRNNHKSADPQGLGFNAQVVSPRKSTELDCTYRG